MDLRKLDKILENEKPFRKKQIYEGLYRHFYENLADITGLPKPLMEKLKSKCSADINAEVFEDLNTVKVLITLEDGEKVEAVLMRHGTRNTVCVSCQVGCALGCKFCSTGKMGLIRNLTSDEILEQVVFFSRYLKKEDERITNIVYMGMGEPLMNLEAVLDSIKVLNDDKMFAIGIRRISISTAGYLPGITKLIESDFTGNLAFSLHSPYEKTRSEIMPVNDNYSLADTLGELSRYVYKTKRKLFVEYLLLKGVNDDKDSALALADLLKMRIGSLVTVNLIEYNYTGVFDTSPRSSMLEFKNVLAQEGVNVTERYRFGRNIEGACGQLATDRPKSVETVVCENGGCEIE